MAKKKRKHRRPVAPPVHSAPETVPAPGSPRPAEPPPARPITPEPPPAASEPWTHATPGRPATRSPKRRPSRRKSKARPYVIAGAIVVLIAGAIIGRQALSSREANAFNKLMQANGCSRVRTTSGSGSGQHLAVGATTRYDTSPPTHGAHDGRGVVPHGIYDKPFTNDIEKQPSIFRAVHSLEHGYIIVWHKGLTREQERELERKYRDERKVIVVPYPRLRGDTKVTLTAWGRMVNCERSSTRAIDAFVDRFREARTAPEPRAA